MLSKALEDLDTRSAKLNMYLAGLRVPEELEGVIEYARVEAEGIFDRVTYLEMMVKHNEVPDTDFPGPVEESEGSAEASPNYQFGFKAGARAAVEAMTAKLDELEGRA